LNRLTLPASLLIALLPTVEAQQTLPFVLHDGTPLRLRLNRNVSSADAKVGESVDFEVLEDVKVNEVLVIARGSTALATVTEAVPKKRLARGGKLGVNIDSVRLVNDEKITLRAVKGGSGGGHTGIMVGGMVATAIVFFPAAPFFLFMKGKDITIPKGTEITAYVDGEVKLDPAKFAPKEAPPAADPVPTPPAVQITGKPLSNTDITALKEAGLSDEVVIAKIKGSPAAYNLDTNDLISLKKENLSEAVIAAMIGAQGRAK
jgi:hypothetical protein